MITVYKYTNINNQKVYIGQTTTSLERRAQNNGSNYKESRRFYDAIKKYSWQAFVPEILMIAETQDEADIAEKFYIDCYKSYNPKYGYNIEHGGIRSFKIGDETKEIISENNIKRYTDKTANPMFGKTHREESLQKMRECKLGDKNPMYGTIWNETQKSRCGTKGKRLNLSDERREFLRNNMRKIGKTVGRKEVRCVEDSVVFESVSYAADHYNVSKSTLCGHLNGRQKSCAGKHFEYLNKTNI